MRRPGSTSIAANPVLIGAVTTLVVVVAVFLAYNANSGLPFVPTYKLDAEVPNAAGLVRGNDVRLGGTRVGTVSSITPRTRPDGRVIAVLGLKLQKDIGPLPADTTVIVRPRSALGLKFVQLTRGTGDRDLESGSTLPLRQATPEPVELDEVLGMFDDKTRAAARINIDVYGSALAGRGADLNFAIQDLVPFLTQLTPVMRNLSSRRTDLRGFIRGLDQAAAVVAPVAETQGELFANLDRTFTALSQVARPYIQDSISQGPETLDTATRDLAQLRPFLANTTTLFHELQPGVAAFADAAPDLAATVRIGTPVLQRSPAFNARLATTFRAVQRFSTDPLTNLGVKDLVATSQILQPTVAYITPAQTVCNYLALFFRNTASLLSEGGSNGTMQRFSILAAPGSLVPSPNSEGGPASAPANGGPPGTDQTNYLHTNPYPFTAAPGQPKSCEAANEKFLVGRKVLGNVPGMQPTTLHDPTRP